MRSVWGPTESVPTLTGASQGSVCVGRDILKLKRQGFLVSKKVRNLFINLCVAISLVSATRSQHVTCETDEDCDRNEVCMSWQYDPTLEYARYARPG